MGNPRYRYSARARTWTIVLVATLAGVMACWVPLGPHAGRELRVESYEQTLDPLVIKVEALGANGGWTRVTDVVETADSVTVRVMQWRPPHWLTENNAGYEKVMEIHLRQPLQRRPVLDSSGREVPSAQRRL